MNNKLLDPELCNQYFSKFGSARMIFQGKYSGQFAEDVRKGKYDVNEGVVCKGLVDGETFMTKIKTNDYLKRLRQR